MNTSLHGGFAKRSYAISTKTVLYAHRGKTVIKNLKKKNIFLNIVIKFGCLQALVSRTINTSIMKGEQNAEV